MSNPVREPDPGNGVGTALHPEGDGGSRPGAARIVLDASGGDAPLSERLDGALGAARAYPDATILLCGPAPEMEKTIAELGGMPANVQLVDAPESVGMHEPPVRALREKKRSSIAVGVDMVARGEADAFVSAGNTGAVAAASTLKLGRLKGVQRPGIAAAMKLIDHVAVAIDVGANVDCKPVHLLQYGIMASVFAEGILDIENPRVGLLNVGTEEAKGNDLSKQSFELLSRANLNFIGNVEPGQFMQHGCDILVCDGFVGNVVLKLGEGLLMKLFDWMQRSGQGQPALPVGLPPVQGHVQASEAVRGLHRVRRRPAAGRQRHHHHHARRLRRTGHSERHPRGAQLRHVPRQSAHRRGYPEGRGLPQRRGLSAAGAPFRQAISGEHLRCIPSRACPLR